MRFSVGARLLAVSILAVLLSSCTSSPLTTQIDTRKNPVVNKPSQFQSPMDAIDKFLDSSEAKSSKDSLVTNIRTNSLKVLLSQQKEIAQELKDTGRLRLQPGYSYEFDLESFCVNAGVERPVRGDGLFLGDIQGEAKNWLPVILQKYYAEGISQKDAQILIWSLLSKTKFDQLSSNNQIRLLKLFPDAPIRFGNSIVEDHAKEFLFSQIPSELISAKEQLDKYQEVLQSAHLKFSEMEKILSPVPSRVIPTEVGWLKHEDGYYIHLQADGYQQVRVKIYAPEGIGNNIYFNPSRHVALPGQGQRLALSGNVVDKYKNKLNQLFKDVTTFSLKEARLIEKYPSDAFKIYQAGQKAIHTTWSLLKSSHNYQGDHTDAFRHFMWSGLVAHEVGVEKAREFLSAHEDFPENIIEDKAMDLFNNERGREYSSQYKGGDFEKDLIQEGLRKIRNRELRWIK